jgi:hypothetical protein
MAELITGTGAGGGLKGLAPGAEIVLYRIELDELCADDEERRKTPDLAEAITAADTDARIVNIRADESGSQATTRRPSTAQRRKAGC